jgi:hypothetical protein
VLVAQLTSCAIGTVTNLATRLCGEAEANQILISRKAFGLSRSSNGSSKWSRRSRSV